ncbi:hypothetical protein B0H14DRAFT_2855802 [Mycena olivaceomarginata]|nr:hypothetical protein B0H14DRAFT_2855802 [Mycena olivaceomarginata]
MSDASYEPSSDGPGNSWCLSQQHQEVYNERKRERHAERQYQDTQRKRQKLGSPLIKQESLSPCPTPRPTAVVASERFAEQFAGPLNSQMGDYTYVEQLTEQLRTPSPVPSPVYDEVDIDLLKMRLLDAETRRDEAIYLRDEAVETMHKMSEKLEGLKETLKQVICERDAAVRKQKEWEEAVFSAHRLIRLASEQLSN